jgi:large subunit ribosomal protein L21
VAPGDTVAIEKLNLDPGQPVTFDQVMLVNQDGQVAVGTPTLAGASVVADVLEHKRGDKVVSFKLKRRKGYRKKIGHRQALTVVQVKEIKL